MLGDQNVHALGVFQRAAHDLRIIDALAIIREHAHLGFRASHHAELSKLLALKTLGDGSNWMHVAQANVLALEPYGFRDNRLIHHWSGVRHGEYCGESALGCGGRTSGNGFSVFAAWLTQVNVHVHETWKENSPIAVDGAVSLMSAADSCDHTIFNKHIRWLAFAVDQNVAD